MKDVISEKMKIKSIKETTKDLKIEAIEDPEMFYIPLQQHIGQVSRENIKIRDEVKRFQKIGELQGPVSSKLHSPISGTVRDIIENKLPNGRISRTIVIQNDYKYEEVELVKRQLSDIDSTSTEELLKIIEEAGIVGEGGAQFPTHIKYNVKGKKIKTLILNGTECEPYLTTDYALMSERTEEFFNGIKIVSKILNPEEIYLVIEKESQELKEKLEKFGKEIKGFKIKIVPTEYPQGSELQLIKSVTGKEIAKSTLPVEIGVIVSNVGTVKAIHDAFVEGKPLVERIITISGEKTGVKGNYLVKIGTPISHIFNKIKLLDSMENIRIVSGGPMMGNEITDMNTPIIKGTSGILFLSNKIDSIERKNCISCGYCSDVCPMGLLPMKYEELYRKGKYEKLVKFNLDSCIECGACEYICPSRVPLLESIKKGKEKLRELGGDENGK